jgi:hypothetical protein
MSRAVSLMGTGALCKMPYSSQLHYFLVSKSIRLVII